MPIVAAFICPFTLKIIWANGLLFKVWLQQIISTFLAEVSIQFDTEVKVPYKNGKMTSSEEFIVLEGSIWITIWPLFLKVISSFQRKQNGQSVV